MTPIAPLIEAFLRETLVHQRGASQHTCDSYAQSFQLLFEFAAARLKSRPSRLMLEQIDAGLVSAFLEHLEDLRKNAAVTRNVRLAAIKSFFRFLEYRQPAALDQVRRVLAIPFKKTDTRLVPYLLREELQALLDAPNPATRDGIRDRAMLHVAVCAGLRVSELTGLTINDIDMPSMSIRVVGKGRRERALPLWKPAATALRLRLSTQAARRGRCPSTAWAREEARLSSRAQAHLRDDHSAGDPRHPESIAVAGPCYDDDHRSLYARRPNRKTRRHGSDRTATSASRDIPTDRQADGAAKEHHVMVSGVGSEMSEGATKSLPAPHY